MNSEHTDHGFRVGPLDVSLVYSDDKDGATVLLRTERQEVQVHVSPQGRNLRVFGPRKRHRLAVSDGSEERP